MPALSAVTDKIFSFYRGIQLIEVRPSKDESYVVCRFKKLLKKTTHAAGFPVKLCLMDFKPSDVTDSSGTGMIAVWPSEQLLSYFCMMNRQLFRGLRVLELGAGQTGLAGVTIGCYTDAVSVCITDGGEISSKNISRIITKNKDYLGSKDIQATAFSWNDHSDFKQKHGVFDVIILADCLFFEQSHNDLLAALCHLLDDAGKVVLVDPVRSGQTKSFFKKASASGYWNVASYMAYDAGVASIIAAEKQSGKSLFDPKFHCPAVTIMSKQGWDSPLIFDIEHC